MNKLVLLDRDGVINKEIGDYVTTVSDFDLLPHALYNTKKLKDAGFGIVVVTNQGGIAKGKYSHTELDAIHNKMITAFEQVGVQLDEVYYCPHHPEKTHCLCRKPDSIMLEKALARFGVSAANTFLIGDADRDIEAATKIGIKAFKITSNENWEKYVDEILAAR